MNKGRGKYHKIKCLEVKGGFLDGVKIEFDDNLNCIIGGRGTGKTTIIEFARFALNKMPDEHSPLYKIIEKLVRNNLGNGQLKLTIETMDGVLYTIEKGMNNEVGIFDEKGNPVDISLDKGILFNAEIYSQNEIEEIANDPYYQLNLIDKFIIGEISDIEREIKDITLKLKQNASVIIQINNEIATLKETISELPAIVEKLKGINVHPGEGAQELEPESKLKAIRNKETQSFKEMCNFFDDLVTKIKNLEQGLQERLDECFDKEVFEGENADIFLKLKEETKKCVKDVSQKLTESLEILTALKEIVETSGQQLQLRHALQEKKYNDLLSRYQLLMDKAKERDLLLKKQTELLAIQKKLDKKQEQLKEYTEQRNKLLETLSELRDKRYKLRQKVANDINARLSPTIQVSIEQFGNIGEYSRLLGDLLKGSDLRFTNYATLIERATRIPPQELVRYIQNEDTKKIMELLQLTQNNAVKFIEKLKDKERLFELEIVELYDRPIIQLKDGNLMKDSSQLSTGQKCTTILSILLLESKNPLLIDQPEDNLDNAFIYETVVKSLREMKGKRQLIFVTHNPNIPVLADAERVFVLSSSGKKASITATGTVDEVKEYIETLLEGGKEAFQKRKERYGY